MVTRKRKEAIKEEETVDAPVVELTRFRKLGGGSFYLGGRIIKPQQIFNYDINKIPKAFINSLEVVKVGTESVEDTKTVEKLVYEIIEEEDGKWYVVNIQSKKKISTDALTKEEAEAIVKNLNG